MDILTSQVHSAETKKLLYFVQQSSQNIALKNHTDFMNNPSSTDKLNQKRINRLHGATNHTMTIEEATIILEISAKATAKLMSRWVAEGWFTRIRRGLYVPIKQNEESLVDPWITATRISRPGYIGALSAAEYWGPAYLLLLIGFILKSISQMIQAH
jgi:hypothetical protein